MEGIRTATLLDRMSEYELALCLRFNRACRRRPVRRFFAVVSRLGNGVFWYTLITALPIVYGAAALRASLHMIAVGVVGVAVYKGVKSWTGRERPYAVERNIQLGTTPLDHYSFPSGHTLHAVAFTLVATAYYPALVWVLAPVAALIALSRVILGLHYPTDVLAGAAIGAMVAGLSLAF